MEHYFERDYKNTYDLNAIKVLNGNGVQVGFVATDWCPVYAPKLDLGITYQATILEIEPKVIRIEVERTNQEENIVYDFLKRL